jgi:probable F420-dependent oxidoreductase
VDLGISIGGDLRRLGSLARQAEHAGFESVWVAETARTAFVQAALAAQATSRVTIGTNVALVFPRSPTLTAMAARDLAELSGGRFVLGLGSQVKRVNEQRFGIAFEHPAPKMEEAVHVIREVLATFEGKPIDHRGRFYSITMPPFPGATGAPGDVSVYIAAVNSRMAQAAGRCADGLLGHPLTSPAYIEDVLRQAVQLGAAQAGRTEPVNLTTSVILQVSPDREMARREAALQIAFYATTRTYRPVLRHHGFDDLVEPLRRAYVKGDMGEMIDLALPMVDVYAVAGTAEECRDGLTRFDGVVDRAILGGAWVGPSEERLHENHRFIIDAFAPAG